MVNTLRYHQRWGSEHDIRSRKLNGVYSMTPATDLLETDRVFTRHMAEARYRFRHDAQYCGDRIPGRRELTATRRCTSVSCWAIRPRCAAGTSSIWTRWADRTWCTGRSITVTGVPGVLRHRRDLGPAQDREPETVGRRRIQKDYGEGVFSSPWRSRCARAEPIRSFTRG